MIKKNNKGSHSLSEWVNRLTEIVDEHPEGELEGLSSRRLKRARSGLRDIVARLDGIVGALDPVTLPDSVFDPSNPETMGRIVALALLSQPRIPLLKVGRFYGSGIYAIYYRGSFDAYAPISGREHPIYVGKADPATQNARDPVEQGEKLGKRLGEHGKNISKAGNLSIEDFDCRFLVVASGWEGAAERHLIGLYRSVWNNETNICYGIGKHGDKSTTRGNKRSPWDTLHPGRSWAEKTMEDQRGEAEIRGDLKSHFERFPPFNTVEEAVNRFLDEMCQH